MATLDRAIFGRVGIGLVEPVSDCITGGWTAWSDAHSDCASSESRDGLQRDRRKQE